MKFKKQLVRMEFRGKIHLINHRDKSEFDGFLTDKERLELFNFISGLKTNDKVDFEYFER